MTKDTKTYDNQIEKILEKLTLEEKISMIHGCGIFRTAAVDRLGIPSLVMSDGPMGVRNEFPDGKWMPVGNSDDFVTYSPSNSALAATWNPLLAYESGKILGEEARGRGKDVILAPGINIKRDPLCGRNFEYMSEDPHLIETLTVPFIEGVQESDVAACVKHFAANSQETDRLMVDTLVDERALREIYFPGFEAAVKKAGTYSLMNAYNKLNGTHCGENKELLDNVLREEWKYDGTVISDWGSIHTTKGAAEASMDVEMSVATNFDEYCMAGPLLKAIKSGEIPEELVDKKVRNILRVMFRLKMIGDNAADRKAGAYDTAAHQQGTKKVAQEAIILLKNEEKLLPITEERLAMTWEQGADKETTAPRKRRVLLVGRNAEYNHAAGGGSAEIKALYEVSPLLGMKKALGGNVEVLYAPGYVMEDVQDTEQGNRHMSAPNGQSEDENGQNKLCSQPGTQGNQGIADIRAELRNQACALAQTADEVIFIGGLNHKHDVEGADRKNMKLPYEQDELIDALLQVNHNTIVVMVAGSPVEMPWRGKVKALVWCYYSGMETGTALADILLGRVNPSGKLPETLPVKYEDTVTYKNGQFGLTGTVKHEEGIFVGYRYYEKEQVKPAFAFGHGLSYTEFKLDNLQTEVVAENDEVSMTDAAVRIEVEIENIGAFAGKEVVQCYVTDCECSVERPVKELKAYTKVLLQPGERRTVYLSLPREAFAFYGVEEKAFVVEHGKFILHVGTASVNCPLQAEVML